MIYDIEVILRQFHLLHVFITYELIESQGQ